MRMWHEVRCFLYFEPLSLNLFCFDVINKKINIFCFLEISTFCSVKLNSAIISLSLLFKFFSVQTVKYISALITKSALIVQRFYIKLKNLAPLSSCFKYVLKRPQLIVDEYY